MRCHVLWLKNDMSGVVFLPIAMEQPAFAFHFAEQRRSRIRSQNVKRGALETVGFNPLSCPGKHIFAVFVEAEHKTTVHLNAVVVEDADAARVIVCPRSALAL